MSAVDPTVQETASKDLIEKADEFKAEANKSFKGIMYYCIQGYHFTWKLGKTWNLTI